MVDVAGIVQRLLPIIQETAEKEFNLVKQAPVEAKKLESSLKSIQKLLEAAEARRVADHRIQSWLERLMDITHEIDDKLDEWEMGRGWVDQALDAVQTCDPSALFKRRSVAMAIKDLNTKVDDLDKEDVKFKLLSLDNELKDDIKREIATSFNDLVTLKDQENDKGVLVNKLLSDPGNKETRDFLIISLVGMAGVGKSVLAHLAFQDTKVREANFLLRSWISVSNVFDVFSVAKAILQSFNQMPPFASDLETLLQKIKKSVEGKKILLVLDDVWMEEDRMWNQLKAALMCAGRGSRIMVTTRHTNVARLMGDTDPMSVRPLKASDCWKLFKWSAFRGMPDNYSKRREVFAKIIAEKCDGLPSAARTLGNYMHSRYNIELWTEISEKKACDLDEKVAKSLFAPLAFRYYDLPLPVKRCLSYCSIYPKGAEIDVKELIRMWMVQGYLGSEPNDAEIKGQEYFEMLESRSFFQDIERDEYEERIKSCKMHDIVNDFSKFLSKSEGQKTKQRSYVYSSDLIPPDLDDICRKTSIRILILKGKALHSLPNQIGDLIHLRSLILPGNSIKELPEVISKLRNLLILDLQKSRELSKIADWIADLKKLTHLLIHGSKKMKFLPETIDQLTDLRTLDQFKVGKECNKFTRLGKLNQLRGTLSIDLWDLQDADDVTDAREAKLGDKNRLQELNLQFYGEVRIDVLDALEPPRDLKSLQIDGYKGTEFPRWIIQHLRNLRSLKLKNCARCSRLPSVGFLPCLEYLHIENMSSLESVTRSFYGIFEGIDRANDEQEIFPAVGSIFPKLRKLCISNCSKWEYWEDISKEIATHAPSVMPCLEMLHISDCTELRELPEFLLARAWSSDPFRLDTENCGSLLKHYGGSTNWEETISSWCKKYSPVVTPTTS